MHCLYRRPHLVTIVDFDSIAAWRYVQKNIILLHLNLWSRDSEVGIATRYGLDRPGIETFWGDIFRTRPDWPCGPPILIYKGQFLFPGSKAAGPWRWPRTPSRAEVEGRIELYICSLSGPLWLVLGWTLTLPLHLKQSDISQKPLSRLPKQ